MSNYNAPFPQANDFEKVIKILNIDNPLKLKDYTAMGVYLGDISSRQVDYYLAACVFLGILDDNKEFTELGVQLRNMGSTEQMAELARILISDKIFGKVYFQQKILGFELDKNDVIDIMKDNVKFDCEPMYVRRASTVMSWIRWINKNVG